MKRARDDRERLHALMDALSDETAEMSDEIVVREFGSDANKQIDRISNIVRAVTGEAAQSPYAATKAALIEEKKRSKVPALPESSEQRLKLLKRVLAGGHRWSDSATLAFRELEDPSDLSDEEIVGILEDLAELNDEDDF